MSSSVVGRMPFDAAIGGYSKRVKKIAGSDLLCFWDLREKTGTVIRNYSGRSGLDGAYVSSGLALGVSPDGYSAPELSGTGSYLNVFTSRLQSEFNGSEGTLFVWMKAKTSGLWADGSARKTATLLVDANNFISMARTTNNNEFQFVYRSGASSKSATITSLGGSIGWIPTAISWSKKADFVGFYALGNLVGSGSSLAAWAGSLSSTQCTLGALDTTPNQTWVGNLSLAFIATRALSQNEINRLSYV